MAFIVNPYSEDWAYDLSNNFFTEGELLNSNVIKQSIGNIITTSIGERLFNRNFGSTLFYELFENINQMNGERILNDLIASIKKWENRILINEEGCRLHIYPEDNSIEILIPYVIIKTNEVDSYQKKIYNG